jgi:nucleoside-diphosphate-sugar epimerase
MDSKLALVLGATGGIGGEMARGLRRRGWTVRALARNPPAREADGFEWVRGDAMRPETVAAAARGAALIVHAVNPPGYRNWDKLVMPMLESTIEAARHTGARILLPGTIYNYGPDAFPLLSEASPQRPTTRKGAIRVRMEERLSDAARNGLRSLVVRAGDFFGGRAANNWFSQGLITPGRPVTSIRNPGQPGVGHSWAYLPDVAETMLRLIERPGPAETFETFHMTGFWDLDGTWMAVAIARAADDPSLVVRRFPWWALTLASPVVPTFREIREMRYLWQQPVRLDNARLVAAIGAEPHTPIDEAVRDTLIGLGCLPGRAHHGGRGVRNSTLPA